MASYQPLRAYSVFRTLEQSLYPDKQRHQDFDPSYFTRASSQQTLLGMPAHQRARPSVKLGAHSVRLFLSFAPQASKVAMPFHKFAPLARSASDRARRVIASSKQMQSASGPKHCRSCLSSHGLRVAATPRQSGLRNTRASSIRNQDLGQLRY